MSDVKPFDPAGIGKGHLVVFASDYDALRAENEKLRAALKKIEDWGCSRAFPTGQEGCLKPYCAACIARAALKEP